MAVFVRFLQKEFDVVRVKNRFNHDTVEKVWLRIWNQGPPRGCNPGLKVEQWIDE